MITDEQIKVATDWWAGALSKDYEDSREVFRGELARVVRACAESRAQDNGFGSILLEAEFDLEGLFRGPLKAAGIVEAPHHVLPQETYMALNTNGVVWIRQYSSGVAKVSVLLSERCKS